MKTSNLINLIMLVCVACACQPSARELLRGQVRQSLIKVNETWQAKHMDPERAFWHQAAYQTGNMAAYRATEDQQYLDYALKWANQNQWKGAQSDDTLNWKYSYGETPDYVLFGDWQICFQVYAELYDIDPAPEKIARARSVMEYQMSTDNNDYWWWVDGLYMVMPVMTKLYAITGNELYLEKLYGYYSFARDLMYDNKTGYFYRDAKYIYPKHQSNAGLKDFWARGNGWIFAGFPRVLEDLPVSDPHREEYIQTYQKLAAALKESQQPGGYWTRSILDPEHAPGPETSGTCFFTFGFLWGINNGLLDSDTYLPVVEKSWNFLTTEALQKDGTLGYVQPIGERAIPGQVIDKNSTADFGVGAFLLAASEYLKYLDEK
ncbi:glycoside hydrolase family 88/105 protein [Mangrovibacterium lignilyticum]|uniref:glycoside hydrolase family 88/105 protein n=1 Tax=Mangrovibacterium lignilyticum TaxID=2668052 RepID=UPI0013D73C56|nr:glycoside hydrolase family 88 protein [Mangrovibacterium lignilyticum]